MIKDATIHCGQREYIDNILKLKKAFTYDYLQDSRFLGHNGISDIIYFFKMSISRVGSGVDLVHKMQSGGDLKLV